MDITNTIAALHKIHHLLSRSRVQIVSVAADDSLNIKGSVTLDLRVTVPIHYDDFKQAENISKELKDTNLTNLV